MDIVYKINILVKLNIAKSHKKYLKGKFNSYLERNNKTFLEKKKEFLLVWPQIKIKMLKKNLWRG
jgi:hypothetical protein